MRGVPDDIARVVRAGLRGARDPGHHPAGHELQLPAAWCRGPGDGRVRRRARAARVSRHDGLLRNPRPIRPVQDGRHVERHILGLPERPVRHVPCIQGDLLRVAPPPAQHQTVAAAQARLRRSLHQGQLQLTPLTPPPPFSHPLALSLPQSSLLYCVL